MHAIEDGWLFIGRRAELFHFTIPRIMSLAFLAAASSAEAQAQGVAPIVEDISATSLYNVSEKWAVETKIHLSARDSDSENVRFEITIPPVHGKVEQEREEDGKTPRKRGLHYTVAYRPEIGFFGVDEFTYVAVDDTELRSQPATVTIDVRRGGLRWEISTHGTSGLSDGDGGSAATLGGTSQDFLFTLDWQIVDPMTPATDKGSSKERLPIFRADNSNSSRAKKSVERRRSVHAVFHAGVVSRPQASVLEALQPTPAASANRDGDSELPPSADEDDGSQSSNAGLSSSITYQRAFTFGGDFNVNHVFSADGQGTFVELGALLRGNLDVFVNEDDVLQDSGITYINLGSSDGRRGFLRGEFGFRFALKQFYEDPTTAFVRPLLSSQPGPILRTGNLEQLLLLEVLIQHHEALTGLTPNPTDNTQRRWALRFLATPQIPNAPRGTRFLIGVEMSRDFVGGPDDLRIFYGADVSLDRLF